MSLFLVVGVFVFWVVCLCACVLVCLCACVLVCHKTHTHTHTHTQSWRLSSRSGTSWKPSTSGRARSSVACCSSCSSSRSSRSSVACCNNSGNNSPGERKADLRTVFQPHFFLIMLFILFHYITNEQMSKCRTLLYVLTTFAPRLRV